MKKRGIISLNVVACFTVLCLMSTPAFAVPQLINYQGIITDKTTGDPITSPGLTMKFRIYDVETDGTKLWEESRTIPVENGIYNVLLGAVTPVTTDLFSADERWLEVEVASEVLTPRQRVTSVAYALKAGKAESVNVPLYLSGETSSSLVNAMNTGAGIGVYAQGGYAGLFGLSNTGCGVFGSSPSGYAGYFYGNTRVTGNLEVDGTLSAAGIGDITSVTAGTGLSGGGTAGDVTLSAAVPFSLTGSSTLPIVRGTNSGTGQGLYGLGTSGAGLYGYSSSGYGVQGGSSTNYAGYFSGDVKIAGTGKGIEFSDGTKQTTAAAGGDITAVNASTGLTGGGTSGDVTLSAAVPFSLSGSSGSPIVRGTNTSTGQGVYGQGSGGSGVYGYSSSGYGVQGGSSTNYAGYFSGDVKVSGTGKGVEFPDGTKQTTASLGGDITGVIAGTGLSGGGTSGDVTLKVSVPLSLITSNTNPVITAENTSTGAGLYGKSASGYGVYSDGNLKVAGTGKGVEFPDGTKQTTAVSGGGGGIPTGFSVLGETSTAPPSYTYTGDTYTAGGQWAAKAAKPTNRAYFGIATVNNKIYVIGGSSTNKNENEVYDPSTNTWATKANMPTARFKLAAVALNGKIYAMGGYGATEAIGLELSTNEEYDPSTNTWATKANMPTARASLAAAAANSKIYAIGGIGNPFTASEKVEEYDPSSNTWVAKADIPTSRRNLAVAVVNDYIYALGGFPVTTGWTGEPTNRNEMYSPVSNTWARRTDMPAALQNFATAVVNNMIYVMGGDGADGGTAANEEFDRTKATWKERQEIPYPGGIANGGAVAINGKIYLVGGNMHYEYTPPVTYYIHKKN